MADQMDGVQASGTGLVANQVRHRMDEVSFDDMGDQEVKNIAQPIRAYKVVMD